jgi:hypothetical protein
MGGQACVFYGAAQFSRDLDLLVQTDPENIAALKTALDELRANRIAVPAFDTALLERGHAVHFRCSREDVEDLRIDLMHTLRGVDPFEALWDRRKILKIDGEEIDVVSERDLVLAKKTQRDKDWPMIRRVVEQSLFLNEEAPQKQHLDFWLRELRTPELLIQVAAQHPEAAREMAAIRLPVAAAIEGNLETVADALYEEQREEMRKDRVYWEPLKRELEEFRRAARLDNLVSNQP